MLTEKETLLKLKLSELSAYRTSRQLEYGNLDTQLDLLYNDIKDGFFGTDATNGSWFKHVSATKDKHPKPDIAVLQSEIEDLMKEVDIRQIFSDSPASAEVSQ